MKHFIMTHFNLKLWETDKNNQATQTQEWLERRFQLFEEFCLPSVAAQTDKNFYWFCMFDVDTPDQYRTRVEDYKKWVPQLIPLYMTQDEATKGDDQYLKDQIKKLLDTEDELLITSQLDNDDAIHTDFVMEINNMAKKESAKDAFYVFSYGYQYYTEADFLLKIYYPNNHFPSRVEKDLINFKLVLSISHSHLRKKSVRDKIKIVHVDNIERPLWIEIIHSKNVSNDVRITFRPKEVLHFLKFRSILPHFTWTDFGIQKDFANEKQLWKQMTFYCPRTFRKACSKVRKKTA
jgi:hypothetical protein